MKKIYIIVLEKASNQVDSHKFLVVYRNECIHFVSSE